MAKKAKQTNKTETKEITLEESLDTITLIDDLTIEQLEEKVDASRKDLYKAYTKQKRISNILIPVVGLLMAASFILFMAIKENWSKILGGVIIGVTLVGMVVYYILTKNNLPNKSSEYIRSFAIDSDSYVFSHKDYSKKELYFKKRFAIADFLPDRVYKDIIDIASRNIVSLLYNNHKITVGEVALYGSNFVQKRQRELLFVGKYLTFTNDFHFEDRYIISIKGNKNVDLPTDFDDLVVLNEQNKFQILGKDGADFEKDLGKDLINDLKGIDCNDILLNVNIVFWAGRTSVYLSYSDGVVTIPMENKLDTAAFQRLKRDIHNVLEILVK